LNWVCSLLAIIVLWGFGIWCIADGETGDVGQNFALAQSWVTQNFSWFYIGTQDVWCLMLVYVCFSRYGDIRLGKENERARFGNFSTLEPLPQPRHVS
jgi:choline-glycine betaine transporter